MDYRLLADAAMVIHFGFLAYVVVGGFVAWRWPRAIWPHLILAGWAGSTILFHLNCPLTFVEDWARRRAGEPGLPKGFIDHYLTGVVYPQRYAGLVELLAVLAVAVAWTGVVVRRTRRGRRRRPSKSGPTTQTAAPPPRR